MKNQDQIKQLLPLIGWREYLLLPQLNIVNIKAKIDTGARTSALHAFEIKIDETGEQKIATFKVHPYQKDLETVVDCTASFVGYKQVTNFGSPPQDRPVIITSVQLGSSQWDIELTLTNRDSMGFRMLLGREAIKKRFLVDPSHSFFYQSP